MRRQWMYRAGLALIVLAAWCTEGYFHPDEHFQLLEFANWKAGYTPESALPWEFFEQMRPSLQPTLVWIGIAGGRAIGVYDPFMLAFLLRIVTGVCAFLIYKKWIDGLSGNAAHPYFLYLVLGGLFMPMLSVRFSSENFGSLSLLLGCWYLWNYTREKPSIGLVWAGLALGLSFSFRFQMAFAILGASAWLVYYRRPGWGAFLLFTLAGVAGVLAGVAADRWFYGEWVFTPWNYFRSNILEGKAAGFGVSPWWWYFSEFIVRAVPPVSVVLLVGAIAGFRNQRQHIFTWVLVAFVAGHAIIGHKELRFLFPVVIPFLWLAAHGLTQFSTKKWWPAVRNLALAVNLPLLLYNTVVPMQFSVDMFRFLYHYPGKEKIQVFAERVTPYSCVGLDMYFYHPDKINIRILDELPNDNPVGAKTGDLLVIQSKTPLTTAFGRPVTQVYSQLPPWLLVFNINDWQSRTKWWNVYRIGDYSHR